MTIHVNRGALVLAAALVACDHTAPFTTPVGTTESPFAALVPTQLTFDPGADINPRWSGDGHEILYTFERHLPGLEYPDRCLGALPPTGGQRTREWCWPAFEERFRRDGIEVGALSLDGRLFFVHHYGAGTKQPNPHKGAAYVAPASSIVTPTWLFDMLVAQPGATARWDYFLYPVFTGEGEVTGLGAAVTIVEPCPNCAFDTTYTGLDLVRVLVDRPENLQVLARIGRAAFLSWDRSADRFFFARDDRVESIATDGGEPIQVWQAPRSADRSEVTVTGVAAAAGRLVVSYRWIENDGFRQVIGMLRADGDVDVITQSSDFPRYGELALSPDGRRLVIERRDAGGARDLYLYELPTP
jgi:hypothetical protein